MSSGEFEADITVAIIDYMKDNIGFHKIDEITTNILGEVTVTNRSRIQRHLNGLQVAGAIDKLASSGRKTEIQYRLTSSNEIRSTYKNVSKTQIVNPFSSAPGPTGVSNSYIPKLDIGIDQPSG